MKMKAAVMTKVGAPLEIREVELDPPKANEVLVKILATAVCHSDLNTLEDPTTPIPQVLGHEGAGVVVEVGPNVKTCKVGDKVALSWVPYCGTCAFCRAGKVNLCESAFGPMFAGTLMDGTTRMKLDGEVCYHSSLLSTFAEYTVVPEMSCVKIPDEMPAAQACMIGCGVATGYGASVRAAKVDPGSSVAIFGIGAVGANAIQGAKVAGASRIIACDIKDDNLEQALKFGATDVINSMNVDVVEEIKKLTDGLGADYSIDWYRKYKGWRTGMEEYSQRRNHRCHRRIQGRRRAGTSVRKFPPDRQDPEGKLLRRCESVQRFPEDLRAVSAQEI